MTVRERIEKAGAPVAFVQIPTPGEHPAQDLLNAVFMILGAIGLLSLAVSGFLVINTISAISGPADPPDRDHEGRGRA